MIKVVVQSIPTYSMSVFWLPIGLCKDTEAMIIKVLVGPSRGDEERCIALNGASFVLEIYWGNGSLKI